VSVLKSVMCPEVPERDAMKRLNGVSVGVSAPWGALIDTVAERTAILGGAPRGTPGAVVERRVIHRNSDEHQS